MVGSTTAVTGGGFPSSHGFSHENCCCRFCSCCCGSCCFRALFMFCRPVAALNGVVTTWAKAPTHVNMLRDSPIFPLRKEFFSAKADFMCRQFSLTDGSEGVIKKAQNQESLKDILRIFWPVFRRSLLSVNNFDYLGNQLIFNIKNCSNWIETWRLGKSWNVK